MWGAIDGVTEEVSSIPILVKTVGGLMLNPEQREAFQSMFTTEGWEQLKKGLFSSLVKTITQKSKREYTVSKASVEMILAYYLLISKAATGLAELAEQVGNLAKKIDKTPGIQRYLKKVVKDTPDADKAQKLEKLLDNISSSGLEKLISRLPEDKLDDFFADLSDDLQLARRLVEEPTLVEAWKVIEGNPILRKKPENLENISKWLDEGIEPQKLTDGIAKSKSKQNLINKLGTAKSKLHAQILIQDYDNIPGVVKGRFTPNGSSLSDKLDLPADWADDVDLPENQIRNFTGKIEPLELKPGDKIYRVSHSNGANGPYWTRIKPEKLEDVVGGAAVLPEWNNFQYLYEYTIPDGVTIKSWKGKTARQPVSYKDDGPPLPSNYHLPGGDEQLFISFIGKQDPNFDTVVKSMEVTW